MSGARRNRRSARRFLGNIPRPKGREAQSLVEFALIFPFFMMLMLALMQWSHMFFVHQTLQHAVREAGRKAMVGTTNWNGTGYTSIEDAARQIIYANSMGLLPNPSATIKFTNDRTTNANFGGPTATYTIRVEYPYHYHTAMTRFFNAFFGPANKFNDGSNLIVSTTMVAEKYDDDF